MGTWCASTGGVALYHTATFFFVGIWDSSSEMSTAATRRVTLTSLGKSEYVFLSAQAAPSRDVDTFVRDDGSGRQVWELEPRGDGTVTIALCEPGRDTVVLRARADGAGGVELVNRSEAAPPNAAWVVGGVGDAGATLKNVGAQSFLSVHGDGWDNGVDLWGEAGPEGRQSWKVSDVAAPAAVAAAPAPAETAAAPPPQSSSPSAQDVPGLDQFPPGILDRLQQVTGLTPIQLTVVLGLWAGPEQSQTHWWLDSHGKSVYGYGENIGDQRGVTFGFLGFTTLDGDGLGVLREADRSDLIHVSEHELCKTLRQIENDPKYRLAMWNRGIKTYIQPAADLCKKFNMRSPLSFATVFDCTGNAGIGDEGDKYWGADHVARQAAKEAGGDEARFIEKFTEYRIAHPTRGNSDAFMRKRCGVYTRLLHDGHMNLDDISVLKKYTFIP